MNTAPLTSSRQNTGYLKNTCALIILLGVLLITCLQSAEARSGQWLTLVSLTFDDGFNQSLVRDILNKHGMKATFYINSNLIGSNANYLSKQEVDDLYADGNEIGGHTVNHVDLATLSESDQKAAICDDMQNLINWGYQAYSFAYPFGATGINTQGIVKAGCPGIGTYESARAVGGLVSLNVCKTCPWANTYPPANPYYIASNSAVNASTTLEALQSYVTQAETNGGGWITLLFHRVCANNSCGTLSITPELLDQLLSWLETREAQSTYVRTVHQVMSGDYPAPPPPPSLGINLLKNASLEIDANKNNQADCWLRSHFGSNSALWSHVNNTAKAHSGNFSEQVTITQYSSGDNLLVPVPDNGEVSGGCAPNVSDQAVYQISAWYKSTAPVFTLIYYLDETGQWQYWRDGQQLPASSIWQKMLYYPGTLPAGAKALSFGLYLASTGTLVTDDYALVEILDTTPPVISFMQPPSPVNGASVSGTVALQVNASDDVGISHVDFLVNGTVVGTSTTYPYAINWNTFTTADGVNGLTAIAYDTAGNTAKTSNIQVLVNNFVGNLLNNPSLEMDANQDAIPDCWQFGGYGINSYQWTRLSGAVNAHSGNFAQLLTVSSLTSGDRKLVTSQNVGMCAPTVTPGTRYTLSSWYKSTRPTGIVVFYLSSSGAWTYWQSSASFSASSHWTQASFTPPAVPAGAIALSFGFYLNGPGTLVTDDYAMMKLP